MKKVLKLLRHKLKETKPILSHSKMVVKIEGQDRDITNFYKIVIKDSEKLIGQLEKTIEILKEAETGYQAALNIETVMPSLDEIIEEGNIK